MFKTNKKKIKVLVIALCFIIGLTPFMQTNASAAVADVEFDTNGGVLYGYYGSGGDVTIPSYVHTIASFAFSGTRPGYKDNPVTSITMGSNVTTIKTKAFDSCPQITKITIGSNTTVIEEDAFWCCSGLLEIAVSAANTVYKSIDGVLFNKQGNTLIRYPNAKPGHYTIPNSVTTIAANAFFDSMGYASSPSNTSTGGPSRITIPDSVTTIGQGAFNSCGMTSVDIGRGITHIPKEAFYFCLFLEEVNIPDNVKSIGEDAFKVCTRLTRVTIPDSVVSIGANAFDSCILLTDVNIPNSMTTIGDGVFRYCRALTSVKLPDSITSIGSLAFAKCSALTDIAILGNVNSIADNAFNECVKLTIYGYSDTYAQTYADNKIIPFKPLDGSEADVESDNKQDLDDFTLVAVSGDITAELDLLLEKLSLPENYAVTAYSIDGGVTWKAGTPVDKDGTVSKFLNNGGTLVLTNVYDKKIKKPGDDAVIFTFEPVAKRPKANEERLNVNYAILADNSGSTYGAWTLAVRGANSYTIDGYEVSSSSDSKKPDGNWEGFPEEGIQVSVSKQVYFIRKAPVKGTVNSAASKPFKVTALPAQKAPSIKPDYKKEIIKGKAGSSIAVSGEVYTFTKADKGDKLNISITDAINNSSVVKAWILATEKKPASIMQKIKMAVRWTINDEPITIDKSKGNVILAQGYEIFDVQKSSWGKFTALKNPSDGDTQTLTVRKKADVKVGRDGNVISGKAASRGEAVTILYGDIGTGKTPKIKTVDCYGADYLYVWEIIDGEAYMTGLTEKGREASVLYVPSSYIGFPVVSTKGFIYRKLMDVDEEGEWYGVINENMTKVVIPEGVREVGSFANSINLVSVSLPGNLAELKVDMFANCPKLDSINIPNGVTSISLGAFQGCTSLTSVTIPDSVITIGMSAFQGCSSLKSIIIPDSVIVIQSNVFSGCTSLSNVKLSENLQVIGEAAFGLCPLSKVTVPASVTAISALAFSGGGMTSATFMGSKPIMRSKSEAQADIFKNVASDFKIYYYAEYADSWEGYTDYPIIQIK